MSKPAASVAASSSASSSSNPPPPTPWAAIARKGAEAARLEAERKANLRPASNAHRHAIECVLAFLSLAELAKAVRVCPAWRNAAQYMRPIGGTIKLATALVQSQRKSELLRHVATVTCKFFSTDPSPEPAQFTSLFEAMPQLRSLACQVLVPCDPFPWPAKLMDLTLNMDSHDEWKTTLTPARANSVLIALSQSSRALQRLTIRARLSKLVGLDLGFLVSLPELRFVTLDFHWNWRTKWNLDDLQIHTLRQLAQITRLEFPRLESASLRQMLRPPHEFKLASAPTFPFVDARAAECLAALPTLVEVDARLCSSAAFLSKLPLLTTLHLSCQRFSQRHGVIWLLTAEAVVDSLSSCTRLTSLTLTAPLQSSHMCALLPRLPWLRSVTLSGMNALDSLRCFSVGPITSRLTSLTLRRCEHAELELNELGHLHALRNLGTLEIFDSFNEPLTEDDIANYTPPSRFIKRLKNFRHYRSDGYDTPPESDVEEED